MESSLKNSDRIGAIASFLCLLHCLATPFIFIAQSCTKSCCAEAPLWWRLMDIIFLVISFFAIRKACSTTTSSWIKPTLWLAWGVLTLLIINDHLQWLTISETIKNIVALILISLHLYNLKFCQCKEDKCCTQNG